MSFLMAFLDFREPISAWSHCLWLLLSVPATVLLWRRCDGDRAKRFSLLTFGVSLAICYGGSTLFHAVRLPQVWIDRFDAFDHVGIYILIAGSYTPIAWNQLQGGRKWGTLVTAWSLCALGSAFLLICGVFSMFWSTCFYMLMGWGALFIYIELARLLTHRGMFPLLLGGILYTVGALINLMHWPVLWPGVFGEHELFHLFVMAGSLAHFWFMLEVVAPATLGNAALAAPPEQGGPEPAFLTTLASGHATSGLEQLPGPSIPKGYCQPVFLHASPQWSREDGG